MAAWVTGRLTLRRAKPPWLAGSSYSLIVGAPLARSMAALMICLYHTAKRGACAQSACSPSSTQLHERLLSWSYKSGRRGEARTWEGLTLPYPICLLPLPCQGASTLA